MFLSAVSSASVSFIRISEWEHMCACHIPVTAITRRQERPTTIPRGLTFYFWGETSHEDHRGQFTSAGSTISESKFLLSKAANREQQRVKMRKRHQCQPGIWISSAHWTQKGQKTASTPAASLSSRDVALVGSVSTGKGRQMKRYPGLILLYSKHARRYL